MLAWTGDVVRIGLGWQCERLFRGSALDRNERIDCDDLSAEPHLAHDLASVVHVPDPDEQALTEHVLEPVDRHAASCPPAVAVSRKRTGTTTLSNFGVRRCPRTMSAPSFAGLRKLGVHLCLGVASAPKFAKVLARRVVGDQLAALSGRRRTPRRAPSALRSTRPLGAARRRSGTRRRRSMCPTRPRW